MFTCCTLSSVDTIWHWEHQDSCINIQLKISLPYGKYSWDSRDDAYDVFLYKWMEKSAALYMTFGDGTAFEMWSKRSQRDYHFLFLTPSCHLSKTTLASCPGGLSDRCTTVRENKGRRGHNPEWLRAWRRCVRLWLRCSDGSTRLGL